mgnify:CR=1 FL=1
MFELIHYLLDFILEAIGIWRLSRTTTKRLQILFGHLHM